MYWVWRLVFYYRPKNPERRNSIVYKQQVGIPKPNSFTCPECESTRFRVSGSKLECTNCDYKLKTGNSNKYGAKKQELDGKKYDSGFEMQNAAELTIRKKANDIKDFDTQYKTESWAYRQDGTPAFKVSHKVDFRIHHKDGSYELLEAKGVETDDYKWRRKFLENIWLPEHPDHIYTVVKEERKKWRRK